MAITGPRVLTAAAAALVGVGLVVAAVRPSMALAAVSASALFAVSVGVVVVRRDARSPVGPAVAWSAAAIVAVVLDDELFASAPWATGLWPLNLAGVFALLLVFPDGPRPGRLWRILPWSFSLAGLGLQVPLWGASQASGRVTGQEPAAWRMTVGNVCILVFAVSLVLAVASLVVRYRAGDRRTRQRVHWLILAGVAVIALFTGGGILEANGATIAAAYTPFLVAIVTLVPAAVGIAIVRHDLFDVDRVLSGAASWLLTLVVSAVVFGLVVYAVSQAVAVGTGLRSSLAAFVTALTLLPLQRSLASWVGRVVDRDRHVALASVERFAADVRSGRRRPEEIQDVLRQVHHDPDLVVQVARPDGAWSLLDGTPVDRPEGFALEAGGDVIARVRLGWDSARARRRIADLAKAAWVPIEVSRLRLDLREAVTEAEAGRRRLVEASIVERRRLERDLHDGAQQRIVATGMRLRLLQERLPEREAAELDAAVHELRGTVDELRRIANGIRPSRLDDGLEAALLALKESTPLPLELQVTDLPDLSDTQTVTAYLVVSEAVANALKHARASRIAVTVSACEERLSVEIADDGVGGVPEDAPLRALRDRVISIGGSLGVRSAPGAGTSISVVI